METTSIDVQRKYLVLVTYWAMIICLKVDGNIEGDAIVKITVNDFFWHVSIEAASFSLPTIWQKDYEVRKRLGEAWGGRERTSCEETLISGGPHKCLACGSDRLLP